MTLTRRIFSAGSEPVEVTLSPEDTAAELATILPPLAAIRATAAEEVKRQAEAERLRWLTAGEGKAQVYTAKRSEALRYAAAGAAEDPAAYPWARDRAANLAGLAEEEVDQVTWPQCEAVLQEYLARSNAFEAIGIRIERTAEAAVLAIEAAEDAAGVEAVLAALAWPQPAP